MSKKSPITQITASIFVLLLYALFLYSCHKDAHPDGGNGGDPQIVSFAPVSAGKDSLVVVNGVNFSKVPSDNAVLINGTTATVVAATTGQLTVKVPVHAGTGKISVTIKGRSAVSQKDFVYLYTLNSVAGNGIFGYKDGNPDDAEFSDANSVAVDAAGYIYVADPYNHRIRRISATGQVTTFAGSGEIGYRDGQGTGAAFDTPFGIAVSPSNGVVYVADSYNHRIRKITPDGQVSTLAGDGNHGFRDGPGASAEFGYPTGIAVDRIGNLYVADVDNNRVRKITPDGFVSTLAGVGEPGYSDGPGNLTLFNNPGGVAVDGKGYVYVVEYLNNTIRRIAPDGYVISLGGDGNSGFRNGLAIKGQLNYPTGLSVDGFGNIFVGDAGNSRVRKLE